MGSYLLNSGGVQTARRTIAHCQSDLLRSAPRPGYITSETGPTASRSAWLSRLQGDRFGVALGQAVTGGSLVWRRRRVRGVLPAAVVDPGLRPRFFSVLPTPANCRSR
jgi:hypothetical protein